MYNCTYLSVVTFDWQGRVLSYRYLFSLSQTFTYRYPSPPPSPTNTPTTPPLQPYFPSVTSALLPFLILADLILPNLNPYDLTRPHMTLYDLSRPPVTLAILMGSQQPFCDLSPPSINLSRLI